MSDDILQRVLAARTVWADLPGRPGRAVRFTRPGLDEQYRLIELRGPERIRGYLGMVQDWRGFTEADAVEGGGSTPLAFSPELLLALCEDSGDLLAAVLEALQTRRRQLADAEEAAAGN